MSANEMKKVDENIFRMSMHEIENWRQQFFAVSKYFLNVE
jgi:hypothetical protein